MADLPSTSDAADDVDHDPDEPQTTWDAQPSADYVDPAAPAAADEPGAALELHTTPAAGTSVLPSRAEWDTLLSISQAIADSGIAPKVNGKPMTASAIAAISLKGRELGIPPMQALSQIHMIEGRPTMAAELMRALVQQSGHLIVVSEMTPTRATVTCRRNDWPESMGPVDVTWTIEEAKKAGLENKSNWKKHPADMLAARATSRACRQHFADVLMGASYTPDELTEPVNYDIDVTVHRDETPASETAPAGDGGGKPTEPGTITKAQLQRLAIVCKNLGIRSDGQDGDVLYRAGLQAAYKVDTSKDLSEDQAFKLLRVLTEGTETKTPEEFAAGFLSAGSKWLAEQDEADVVTGEVVHEGDDG